MLITKPILEKNGNQIKLSSKVIFENGKNSEIFFSVEKKYAEFICADASPFLASLLLPAMKLNENIHIDSNVSPELLINFKKIMKIVTKWNVGLSEIQVTSISTGKGTKNLNNIGSFFSGGVDSFATYLENKSSSKGKINYFIFVYGFDIFLKNKAAFSRVIKVIHKITKQEKIKLIIVKTNLREIIDPILGWNLSHGGALAATGLFLRNGFKEINIPGSFTEGELFAWGSHPSIDYLWSTDKLKINHDLANLGRFQKIQTYISNSPLALKYLRVCWLNYGYNCGRCNKCIRTMIALQITNSLGKSKTFPTAIKPEHVKNLYITSQSDIVLFQELVTELKKDKNNRELQRAIEYALIKSVNPDIKTRVRNIAGLLDKKFNNERLFWYLTEKGIISRL